MEKTFVACHIYIDEWRHFPLEIKSVSGYSLVQKYERVLSQQTSTKQHQIMLINCMKQNDKSCITNAILISNRFQIKYGRTSFPFPI